MNEINTIYIKEMTRIEELFEKDSKLPDFLRKLILVCKKMFCVVTIKENGVCVLPYRELKNNSKIKLFLIKKILKKINLPIVLSNYLNNVEELKKSIWKLNLRLLEGGSLSNYLIPEIIDYICKMSKEEKEKQDISVLIQNQTVDITKIIIDLVKHVKRIQIVSTKIEQFKKLENQLEDMFGVSCQITNNKRKSLLKSKIIINFDYLEEQLNEFTINPNAIVIDINKKTKIQSKAFCGIHVHNYEISHNSLKVDEVFEAKKVYEGKISGKSYEQIRKLIEEENVQISNLIGKKGVIDQTEYIRTSKKFIKNT